MQVLKVGQALAGVLDPRQQPLSGPREEAVIDGLVRAGELATELAGLGADGVDQAGGEGVGDLDPARLEVLGQDRGGGTVLGADVEERAGLGGFAQRVVVDHHVGGHAGGQLMVAGVGLGVDQGEALEAAEVEASQMAWLEGQGTHHLAVLRSTDQTAVGHRRVAVKAAGEDARQDRRRHQGVGVRVVVREHQPAVTVGCGLDVGRELREALAGALGDHEKGRWLSAVAARPRRRLRRLPRLHPPPHLRSRRRDRRNPGPAGAP